MFRLKAAEAWRVVRCCMDNSVAGTATEDMGPDWECMLSEPDDHPSRFL